MPDWLRDASLITAIVLVFNAVTGRLGSAVKWCAEFLQKRRDDRQAKEDARKATKAQAETIELLNQEREIHLRIIDRVTKENERLHRIQSGGAP